MTFMEVVKSANLAVFSVMLGAAAGDVYFYFLGALWAALTVGELVFWATTRGES